MKNFFLSALHSFDQSLFWITSRAFKKSQKNTPGKRRVNQNKTHRKGEKWRAGVLNVGLSHRIRVDQLREKSRPGVLFDRGSNPFESINSCIFSNYFFFFFLLSSSSSSSFFFSFPPFSPPDGTTRPACGCCSIDLVEACCKRSQRRARRRTSTRIGFFFLLLLSLFFSP